MARDLSREEDFKEAIEKLREARDQSRSQQRWQRLDWALKKAEASHQEVELTRSREGKLPCPSCGEWFLIGSEEAALRCSACGRDTELAAIHAVTGIWKIHLVSLGVFWGIAWAMLLVAINGDAAIWLRIPAGLLAVAAGITGLPFIIEAVMMCKWLLRGSPKSRPDE